MSTEVYKVYEFKSQKLIPHTIVQSVRQNCFVTSDRVLSSKLTGNIWLIGRKQEQLLILLMTITAIAKNPFYFKFFKVVILPGSIR